MVRTSLIEEILITVINESLNPKLNFPGLRFTLECFLVWSIPNIKKVITLNQSGLKKSQSKLHLAAVETSREVFSGCYA